MTSVVQLVARMLDPDQRDAVLGDLAESGATSGEALRGVLGLVVRKQASYWMDWRPWFALIAIVLPFGAGLSIISRRVADGSAIFLWLYGNNWKATDVSDAWFRQRLLYHAGTVSGQYLALFCCAWACGLTIGYLSRRALWMNGCLLCLALLAGQLAAAPAFHGSQNAAVFSLAFYNQLFPVIVQMTFVVLPALWGMYRGKTHEHSVS